MSTTAVQDIEELQTGLQAKYPHVRADGDIGKITTSAVRDIGARVDLDLGAFVQRILARKFPSIIIDGRVGSITLLFLAKLDELGDLESVETAAIPAGDRHTVKASSFADLADVRGFNRCKERGGSDVQCFKVGDNGVGKWGALTAQEDVPMVALPREVWRHAGKTGGARVHLTYKGRTIEAVLGDTMPALENIENGAGIDTNPAVAKAFGLHAPYMVEMTWEWA